jgi:hypothetical protein
MLHSKSKLKYLHRLFDVAESKMKDDHDKEVIKNLYKLVEQTQEDLFAPKPRYMDTMFFPNEDNVAKLCRYLGKATRSLRICVFNFTNNSLSS